MRVLVLGGISRSLVNFRGEMLRAMIDAGHEVCACAGEVNQSDVSKLREWGIEFRGVDLERRGTSIAKDWRYRRAVGAVIGQCRPDVVLSYTIKPVVYGSLAARSCGVRTVAAMITGAGIVQPGTSFRDRVMARVGRTLYSRALRAVDVVFFQNPDDEMLFREYRLLGKSRVIQIAGKRQDLDWFFRVPARTGPVTFLLIARLLENKGVHEYVEAARLLKKRYPAVQCLLVGPCETGRGAVGPEAVKCWHNQGWIDYRGPVDDVRQSIADASVYVLPSYREGLPRTVVEAMAMGRPIITTDVPGCRETVMEGVNGYLVPKRDPVGLEAAMRRFVEDASLIEEMGLQSRRLAEQRFDVRRVNDVILSALGL